MPHDAYVRIASGGLASVRSRADGRVVEAIEGKPYCRVEWGDSDAPEGWLRETSRDLGTEVLWLVTQKQVDAFAFQHWVAGESKRRLSYGIMNERTWEMVEGLPEHWEAEVLFSSRALERRLKVLQVIDMPREQRGKAAEDLKRVWAERLIEVGATEPTVSAGSAGPAIVRYYDLPGWS